MFLDGKNKTPKVFSRSSCKQQQRQTFTEKVFYGWRNPFTLFVVQTFFLFTWSASTWTCHH